ncbi:MAG: hypothetical protein CM15mP113_2510 [Pseudomonadota bacterium]|nr:MAG: hypothetical protein CM15mP113_2510 [Pseudomonadota bacterium]
MRMFAMYYNINIVVLKNKMEKEKTPVERLHDDIRQAIEKIEDDVDDIVRIHCHENDDAG